MFVPTLALALGLAPWVAVSLGLRPDPAVMSVAGLVALMTVLQVWATPAVTVLSARKRELIPAAASAAGLAVAAAVWVIAVVRQTALLLPLGLALGAVVRSLIPVWILSGRAVGSLSWSVVARLGWSVGLAGAVAALSFASPVVALSGGAVLVAGGLAACYRVWDTMQRERDAHPARQ